MTTSLRIPVHVRRRATAAAVAAATAASALALSSCAGPSRAAEAKDLRAEILEAPGVADVRLTYREPITLDSGKLALTVTMDDDAAPEAVVAVVDTAYAAFSDVHHSEEADLDVRLGDDRLHLRSFEPRTEPAAVTSTAEDALKVMGAVSVFADITTQDAGTKARIRTNYNVTTAGDDRQAVLATLDDVQEQFGDLPNAWWRISNPGESGWRLAGAHTFPSPEERKMFDALDVDLPPGTRIGLEGPFTTAYVTADVAPAAVAALARQHLTTLGGPTTSNYQVEQVNTMPFWITDGECGFDTSPLGIQLEKELSPLCERLFSYQE